MYQAESHRLAKIKGTWMLAMWSSKPSAGSDVILQELRQKDAAGWNGIERKTEEIKQLNSQIKNVQ